MAAEDALQESRGLGVREPVQGGQETLGALEWGATTYHSSCYSLWYRTDRLAHVQAYLPDASRRDGSSDESATGTHASRRHSHHDERIRQSYGRKQTRGARQGGAHGASCESGLVPLSAP